MTAKGCSGGRKDCRSTLHAFATGKELSPGRGHLRRPNYSTDNARPAASRRFMWEPLCLAALNTPPEKASAQVFANVLRDSLGGERSDTDLLLPNADLNAVFPDAAARFITGHGGTIRLSERVARIERPLHIAGEAFDDIVIATAPQHAIVLLQDHPQTAAITGILGDYRYEPIGTVYLGYPAGVRLPLPMLGMDVGSPDRLGQWVFDRGQLGDAEGVIGCVLSARRRVGRTRQRCACGNTACRAAGNTRTPAAPTVMAQGHPRTPRHVFPVNRDSRARNRGHRCAGLWLAGDYVCADYPATLEGAIRSGSRGGPGNSRTALGPRDPQGYV